MVDLPPVVRLGTRGSALARWQTNHVADLLKNVWPDVKIEVQIITTRGDQVLDTPLPLIGGKGLFTEELERALHNGKIDFAVHSLKDLPTAVSPGLATGAIPQRAAPNDVVVSRSNQTFENLPRGATIGTSSRRRAAQLLYQRPDLQILDIRGNVETRIKKTLADDGPYDATILAQAGVERLGHLDVVTEILPLDFMLPAPGQGALGIQCREEAQSLDVLHPIVHQPTQLAVTAERAFLEALGGGCSVPVAAYAQVVDDRMSMRGRVTAIDGTKQVDVEATVAVGDDLGRAAELGTNLAQQAIEQGAMHILESVS